MKKLLTIVFALFFCMLANNVTAAPSLIVSEMSIDFGTISVGATDTRTFTVQGSGLSGKVNISSNNSELTVSPSSISRSKANSGAQTITLTLTPTAAGSGSATVTLTSSGATSKTVTVTWTATSGGGGGGGGDSEVVELPGTVNKGNVASYSSDMTWYGGSNEYFDFGPTDAPNTGRWAEWTVHLSVPGQYIITEDYYCPNGRGWRFQLLNGGGTDVVTPYETGNQDGNTGTKTYSTKWDLRGISAGNYTLRVTNIRSYGQPKLRSLTFDFDGEILPEPDPIAPWSTPGTTVNYTADNTTVFPNPERGFLDQLEAHVTSGSPYCVKGHDSYFNKSNRENERLVLVLYYLDKLKTTTTLPSAVLNGFNEDMQVLRNKGYKCVLRYAYCQNDNNDATKSVMLGHISQLAPYWAANKDVIYAFQVGFIGPLGRVVLFR